MATILILFVVVGLVSISVSVCICVLRLTMMIVVNNLHQLLNKEHLLSQVAELDVKKAKKERFEFGSWTEAQR